MVFTYLIMFEACSLLQSFRCELGLSHVIFSVICYKKRCALFYSVPHQMLWYSRFKRNLVKNERATRLQTKVNFKVLPLKTKR